MNYNILVDNTNNFNNSNSNNSNVNQNNNTIHISNSSAPANCNANMNIPSNLVDLAALSSITTEVKTADIRPDNEFGNLFRGLSSVIDIDGIALDSFASILERQASKRQDGTGAAGGKQQQQQNNSEPSMDLSDLILQGQSMHHQSHQSNVPLVIMPSENTAGGGVNTRKSAEKMANVAAPSKMITRSSSDAKRNQNNNNSAIAPQIQPQSTVSAEDSSSKSSTRRSGRVNVKRLSTGSNASSSTSGVTSSDLAHKPERRGRKPASMTANGEVQTKTAKMKQIAKVQLQVEEDKLARFGNKFVIKDTDEYEDRRKKNNEAVKKCREKNTQLQQEREEKMNRLNEENRRLQSTVENLTKELNVLKGIIKQTTPISQLPARLQSILKEDKE